VAWELELQRRLGADGWRVPIPVSTPTVVGDHVWAVMSWVPGQRRGPRGDASRIDDQRRRGHLLGELHPGDAGPPRPWSETSIVGGHRDLPGDGHDGAQRRPLWLPAGAGFTAVVDDIFVADRLVQLLAELEGLPVRYVMLAPPFEHVRRRWIDMGSPFADTWGWIHEEIRLRTKRVGRWLDTADLTPEQIADQILTRLDEATVSA
jgi:hypothetical protein